MKRLLPLLFALVVSFVVPNFVLAHPGNTDSSGCHTCRTNCSSWGLSTGEYHCHNNKGTSQPVYPVSSTYGAYGTGYTTPNSSYAYPSIPTTPSCPSMSSYDSSSGSCKCYSGYIVSGGSCVNADLYCSGKIGLMSEYNSSSKTCECMYGYEYNGSSCVYKSKSSGSTYTPTYSGSSASTCPTNSSPSSTDSTKCSCNVGYQTNEGKDACVVIPKTKDQECKDSFGVNSSWGGTYTASNGSEIPNCICGAGYQWNVGKTSCVSVPTCTSGFVMKNNQCVSNTDDCKITYGENVIGTPDTSGNSSCNCSSGYEWNASKTSCTKTIVPIASAPIISKEKKVEQLKIEPIKINVKPVKINIEKKPIKITQGTATTSSLSNVAIPSKPEIQREGIFQRTWKQFFNWF